MNIKKILSLTACLGSVVLTNNSFAQTALDRSNWSLSTNRNAADTFLAIDNNASTRWTTALGALILVEKVAYKLDLNGTSTKHQN